MSDEGYTLAETLVALVIIALAIGGLAAAIHVITVGERKSELTLKRVDTLHFAQAALEGVFAGSGPFPSNHPELFSGDSAGFQFQCAGGQSCSARLSQSHGDNTLEVRNGIGARDFRLPAGDPPRFLYVSAQGPSDAWPPAGDQRQTLRSVALLGGPSGAQGPLIQKRFWREEPAECQFDVVLQDCR
jgi:type II secretory pathway pseudopilin PulG